MLVDSQRMQAPSALPILQQLNWICTEAPCGLMHMQAPEKPDAPRCLWRQKKQAGAFKKEVLRAQGVDGVKNLGRILCPACLTIAGPAIIKGMQEFVPACYFPHSAGNIWFNNGVALTSVVARKPCEVRSLFISTLVQRGYCPNVSWSGLPS